VTTNPEHRELAEASFRVGDWLVEPRLNRLTRGEESIQIELKMMDVLVCLAARAGELVTRREITDTVWATEFITEKTLTRAVAELRRTFGDDAKDPRYIETIHRKGYRLIVPVEIVKQSAATVTPFPARAVQREDERSPYPGLAAFREDDADFFYGRESEVTQLWRKITTRRLLALIGPSGIGKSSLLRAGLIPASPEGWGTLIFHPGEFAFRELARALVPEFKEDTRATAELLDVDTSDRAVAVVSRWRGMHQRALLMVDQFEELFTLNSTETAAQYAELLGRLARDADVHVLLSMRDDFLYRCHEHAPLRPILEGLTALERPNRASLRRALERPAADLGYAFESNDLVEAMLDAVTEERSALPFLAFAVARLWDLRDRDRRLLTRQAYEDIGGVSGAVARHAESVLQSIGKRRTPLVREIFRNLVTAEGTRAVRSDDDLLSVFPGDRRNEAAGVLGRLVDARLLTSFQQEGEEGDGRRRVEVAHESLLTSWPRLVGWQTQDADSARLRDELRQAARTWDEHDQSDDLLWTGSAYREFVVWRERYPGGLSDTEESFGEAMTRHARRRRRRRRTAIAAAFVILLAALAIIGGFWRRSVAEVQRAEASKLVTLGTAMLDTDRSAGLAFAIASLERADTPQARRLALRALWAGPPATVLSERRDCGEVVFSPDGRYLVAGCDGGMLRVFLRDGSEPFEVQAFDEHHGYVWGLSFSPDGQRLVGGAFQGGGEVRVWETRSWAVEHILRGPEPLETLQDNNNTVHAFGLFETDLETVLTASFVYDGPPPRPDDLGRWVVRRWPLDDGPSELVGQASGAVIPFAGIAPSRGLMAVVTANELQLHRLETLGSEPPQVIGRLSGGLVWGDRLAFDPSGQRLAAWNVDGQIRVWPVDGGGAPPERTIEALGGRGLTFSPDGSWLFSNHQLWSLRGPASAEPVPLGRGLLTQVAFNPDGRWLAGTDGSGRLAIYPLSNSYRWDLRSSRGDLRGRVAFHPDGSRIYLKVSEEDGLESLLSWPLAGGAGLEPTVLFRGLELSRPAVDPSGRFLVVGAYDGTRKIPLDGGAPTIIENLEGFSRRGPFRIGPAGRLLAYRRLEPGTVDFATARPAILELETGDTLVLEPPGDGGLSFFNFDPKGRLIVTRGGVVSRWDPRTGATEVLVSEEAAAAHPIDDGRLLFVRNRSDAGGDRWILDLAEGTGTALARAHQPRSYYSIGRKSSIVATAPRDGVVFVGPFFDEQPHLLLRPGFGNEDLWMSPDGEWVASSGDEGTLHLWPVPDLTEPPLHTLPYEQLMAKLEALTNLRATPDEGRPSGYTVEPDYNAYRGWAEVPTW
jgi:DNA-binding winged helix-turn-helix (wHTH) protein/WD40 repeat protein